MAQKFLSVRFRSIGLQTPLKIINYSDPASNMNISEEEAMQVLADTIMHEMSHWKVNITGENQWLFDGYSTNPAMGWNFGYHLRGGTWTLDSTTKRAKWTDYKGNE